MNVAILFILNCCGKSWVRVPGGSNQRL